MQIRINELKLPVDHTAKKLEQEIRKALRLRSEVFTYEIMRQSVDARKKPELFYVYTIDVSIKNPKQILAHAKNRRAALIQKEEYQFPTPRPASQNPPFRPIIVGSGPAGLFCALMLARSGLAPIVLERGQAVEERVRTVEQFWETGELNPSCNVQFGEGGAGTFSDGKLNTLIKDPSGRIRFVLKEFVRAGASPEILYHHKPHIGTDVLIDVVRNIRNEIIACGGSVLFESCLSDLECITSEEHTRPLYRLSINNGASELVTDTLVLAIGHSARDTFEMLLNHNISMQPKSFAVGLRMEHQQQAINAAMYGADCPYEMGAAPYKVTHKCENGRGVYSFCMCPGGYVVNASSEPGMTAVNGMSYSDRGSQNANSAIVVTVNPEDFAAYTGDSVQTEEEQIHPLAGLAFQRTLEKAAYECGNGRIPVQRFGDFCENRPTEQFGSVTPQMKGSFQMSNLRTILPEELNASLIEGIHGFGKRIAGFDTEDALLSGIESRTSSPVRILRGETCESITNPGIFPCGEGAGYAGGITSAAVDGIRVAEAILHNYENF